MTASFVIDLAAFTQGRQDFDEHYCLGGYSTSFSGQDFKVAYDDIAGFVSTFASGLSISENDVALRFVHCYDGEHTTLYLRMQLCVLTETEITNHGRDVYGLDVSSAQWYVLTDGIVESTETTSLSDTDYLDHFYYSATPLPTMDPLENLASDTGAEHFVRNLVFPWSQIAQMYSDNSSPADAKLHFAACSYTAAVEGDAGIEWPHVLVLYLDNSSDAALLNNTSNPLAIFENKGADMATVCPPQCGSLMDSSSL